jgi:hypothetical protein
MPSGTRSCPPSRFATTVVRLCHWYQPVKAVAVVRQLVARNIRRPWQFKLWHAMVAVALAAVLLWGCGEYGFYRIWLIEALMEKTSLDQAEAYDVEVIAFKMKSANGEPFAPRVGFMPYGPIPVGGHAPRSWEEEMAFSAKGARIARAEAEGHARIKRELERRWRPG